MARSAAATTSSAHLHELLRLEGTNTAACVTEDRPTNADATRERAWTLRTIGLGS